MKLQVVTIDSAFFVSIDQVDTANKYYGVYLPIEGRKAFITRGYGQFECRCEYRLTEGAYLSGYCHSNLRELLFQVHNNNGLIYQFDTLMELMQWLTSP